ncbi:hypothetical protein HCEG_03003 [Histoplasma capsulatum var. duboisii H88]|uniref:Uncharacterized protein n=2 Tax=Ajellomyces capsulatus TaxID=5037 RepID=F0UAY1_AJEC8|nr:hypothetical protein HCDG_03567 [Histoplasma capsulatum H143]EGC43788.1 hypothetical protein HCEG_03003 [Histoplasma capsulatum var. duboisii H88]
MFFTHRQSVKRFSSSFGLQTERIKGPKSNIDLKRGQKDKNLAPFPSGRKNPEEHLRFDIAMTMIRCPNLQELYPTRRPNLHVIEGRTNDLPINHDRRVNTRPFIVMRSRSWIGLVISQGVRNQTFYVTCISGAKRRLAVGLSALQLANGSRPRHLLLPPAGVLWLEMLHQHHPLNLQRALGFTGHRPFHTPFVLHFAFASVSRNHRVKLEMRKQNRQSGVVKGTMECQTQLSKLLRS